MPREPQSTNIPLGVILMLLAQFLSASVVTAVKVVSLQVSTPFIICVSYGLCCLSVLAMILFKGGPSLKTKHLGLQISRSVLGGLYFGGLFFAVKFISVVDGVLLRSTAPLWVPFVAWAWLKEGINPKIYWGLLIGFVGVAMVLHPNLTQINIGYFIALVAAICFACSTVASRKLNVYKEPLLRTLFYTFLIPSLVLVPIVTLHWPKLDLRVILLMAVISFGTLTLLLSFIASLKHASPIILSPLAYAGVVFAGIYDWLLWRYTPTWVALLGMLLVFLGCSAIIWVSSKGKYVRQK